MQRALSRLTIKLRKLFIQLSPRQFLILASVAIAIATGLMVVALKFSVHYLQLHALRFSVKHPILTILIPLIGIGSTVLFIRYFFKNELSRGTAFVLLAIARKGSKIPPKEIYGHPISTALTVGLGGSAGIEAPIVQTGAAIGSVLSSYFPIGYKERTLLLACGAAAGIGAAFNAPIAGVLLALEVLLVDINVAAFIPLLIAGATGALCSNILSGEKILLSFPQTTEFNYHNIPFYIILGVFCGLSSVYYIRSFVSVQNHLKYLVQNELIRITVACIILGSAIMFIPALFGEGITAVKSLADNNPIELFNKRIIPEHFFSEPWTLILLVFSLVLIKPLAVGLTIGSGGTGGNFAPSLFVGACLGFSAALMLHAFGFQQVPIMNFCLVGMAGSLAGIFHSPLTAIFLIAELTGGYGLMIPLITVSAISTWISKYLNPASLDETILNQKLKGFSFDKDVQVLSFLNVKEFIENDFGVVKQGTRLRDFISIISHSKRNIFPVLNGNGGLEGIIMLDDIREVMFDHSLYDTVIVDQLMQPPLVKVSSEDSMSTVMEKFDKHDIWSIPVEQSGRYLGFISKSKIFSSYRENLKGS
jgi:CIC family chloride channel protein